MIYSFKLLFLLMSEELGTFSVKFSGDDGYLYAIDWNWNPDVSHRVSQRFHQWSRSASNGVHWDYAPGLDSYFHSKLLEGFGLEKWTEDYPMWRVFHKPPAWLAGERQKKEKEFNLPRMEVMNQNMGKTHIPAKSYTA